MKDFITVAVFHLPQETIVLKSILQSEGIVHFFENETIVSINPFASLAYGGIKLKIRPKNRKAVQKILDNLNSKLKIV